MEIITMEEKLIELVRNQPCLYDRRHPLYKNNGVRDKKFESFSRILNIPARRLKDRWRTLRDKYYKEIKTPPCGSVVSVIKKKWKWMDHLTFLKDIERSYERSYSRVFKSDIQSETEGETEEDCGSTNTAFHKVEFPPDEISFEECVAMQNTEKNFGKINECSNGISDSITLSKEVHFTQPVVAEKSARQLFFDCLAKQTEDAQLSGQEFANLQMELLKTFNRIIYEM